MRCLVIRINELKQKEFVAIKEVLHDIWKKRVNESGKITDTPANWIDELYEECDLGIYGYSKALENLESQINYVMNGAKSPDEIYRMIKLLEIKHHDALIKQNNISEDSGDACES